MALATVTVFTDVDLQRLGAHIRAARRAHGLTQEQVAWRADITVNHYGLIEGGKAKGLRVQSLYALCQVLSLSADYLLGLTDSPSSPH